MKKGTGQKEPKLLAKLLRRQRGCCVILRFVSSMGRGYRESLAGSRRDHLTKGINDRRVALAWSVLEYIGLYLLFFYALSKKVIQNRVSHTGGAT